MTGVGKSSGRHFVSGFPKPAEAALRYLKAGRKKGRDHLGCRGGL
jgi:hypothetical protein